MSGRVNPITGEVEDDDLDAERDIPLPIRLSDLDEERIAQLYPTRQQIETALLASRGRRGAALLIVKDLADDARNAKRALSKRQALARRRERAAAPGATVRDIDAAVLLDPDVEAAQEAADLAAAKLRYARDLKHELHLDIEVLRSINANARAEASR